MFIEWTISSVTRFGLETPTKTSAPFNASANVPCILSGLVISHKARLWGISPSCLSLYKIPNSSTAIILPTPAVCIILIIAVPAAPGPFKTTVISLISFFVTLKALYKAAKTTTAVPCWSSWNTGISNIWSNLSSISKQSGEAISSKLIPPKHGAIFLTVWINSSLSCVSKQIGTALTSPNFLNRAAFPSMTGIEALAPIFPSPKTAVPFETTAIVFDFVV